jgi:hypothetical protein
MFPRACTACHEVKSRMAFYAHPKSVSGRMTKCKDCVKAAVRKYRAEHIERVREYDRNRPNAEERAVKKRASAWKYKRDNKAWQKRNPEKRAAHILIGNFVRAGKIVKPLACECCHEPKRLHGHHDDYSKPLDVVWLCQPCHGQRHRWINEMQRKSA